MSEEVPLIKKIVKGQSFQYLICPEGVFLLKTLKFKKLRILFNITHRNQTLNQFNHWLINQNDSCQESHPIACLTISTKMKQISEERVIVILNAFQCLEDQPFMVLLGYLGASVFLYHHFQSPLSIKSSLTILLSKLWVLMQATDINKLNSELSHSKGYAKNPYFLCLLSQNSKNDELCNIYRCIQGEEDLNRAVDALIDYFPERSELILPFNKQKISAIGSQFQDSVQGRTVFNFQFTGNTLQNLCFDCCEAFNQRKSINLSELYLKIIENQKTRLEGECLQLYMSELSSTFFLGGKVDFSGQSQFPLSGIDLKNKTTKITQLVFDTCIQSATNCMTLTEFRRLQKSLRNYFNQKSIHLQEANSEKAVQFCRECFDLLDHLSESDNSVDSLYDLFRQISNKMELFSNQCQTLTQGDQIQRFLWQSYSRLFQKHFNYLENISKEVIDDLQLKQQEQRVEIQSLRYKLKVSENQLRKIQFQYQVQGDILNETKHKLLCEEGPSVPQITFTLQANKLRRRLQEMQQQIRDKTLNIQQLEGILQRIEGVKQKDKNKYKFSKEIQELIKQVSQKINIYFNVVRQAKEINQLQQQIKKTLTKQKAALTQQKNQIKQELAQRNSQIERLKAEKNMLQETVNQSRYTIQILRNAAVNNKESINTLERNNAQFNCILAETDAELQNYKKALSLAGEQVTKGGKSQSLLKFCRVIQSNDIKQMLKPFIKK